MIECTLRPKRRHQWHTHTPQLFREYARTRDVELRNRLVLINEPLARCVAARFADSGGSTQDDLSQVACLGLIAAIERYEPEKGPAFAAFAVPTIEGAIRNHLRDHCWLIKAPRSLRELGLTARKVRRRLEVEWGRSPTLPEMARQLCVPVETLTEALGVEEVYRLGSLETHSHGAETDQRLQLVDVLGTADPCYSNIETREALSSMLRRLPEREREVIKQRFFSDLSQAEVATRMRVSQMQVSRLEHRALQRLRMLITGSAELAAGLL